jgi:transcriptional regulator with XRE-family HTH domain
MIKKNSYLNLQVIENLLYRQDMTHSELAKALNVRQSVICDLFKKRKASLSLENLAKLCLLLNVDYNKVIRKPDIILKLAGLSVESTKNSEKEV